MLQAIFLILTCCIAGQTDTPLEAMHKGAKRCIDATVKGDFATLADLTHPGVLERVGGRERMIELIEKGMKEMKAQGMTFTKGTTEPPEPLTKADDGLYGVIPTTIVLDTKEAVITLKSFLIGFSKDNGKTWVYIDGANGPDAVRQVFPEIPQSLTLPDKQKPKVETKLETEPEKAAP
jgi:hypothetical protein